MNNSLRFRLILFTFGSILLTLFVAGISINVLLVGLYSEKADHESEHAYELIYGKIKDAEKILVDQSHLIAIDPAVIAPVNLINRYQNINDYQPLIFDEEKKLLANHLLKRTSVFHRAKAALYDKKGYLIAFTEHHEKNDIVGITTYKNNKEKYLTKNIETNDWQAQALPFSITSRLKLPGNIDSFISRTGEVEYHSNESDFSLSSVKIIQRRHLDGSEEIVGFIKIIQVFNEHYIENLTNDLHVNVSIKLANNKFINKHDDMISLENLDSLSSLFGSTQIAKKEWLENEVYYIQSYVMPVVNGKIFIVLSQSRTELESALNKSRYLLLLIFLFIALLIIPFGIYWLNKRVSRPLNILTKQLATIGKNEYPNFYLSKAKDEISLLGNGLNNMVEVIKSREEALKASQIDLKEAQHLAKIGSWKLNHINKELVWSDEMFQILGVNSELVEPSFETFLYTVFPEDKILVSNAYNDSIKNKAPFDLTHRLQMGNGDIKYIHEHCELIIDDKSNILYSKGTIQDVTEQKLNSEILNRTQKMDALGKLTGGIAHDFNNMLGVILGYSELLQSMLEGDESKLKYIDHVIDASTRASTLTKKLLSFSRKEATEIESVNINDLLTDDRNLLEKTLTSRIELVYDFDNELWPVRLDINDMQNAVLNMSINAMHAMKSTGKLVMSTKNLHLNQLDAKNLNLEHGDYVLLSITDTGIGMDEEVRSKLFDPFFSTKGEKGTGLGMSQVYGFVQQTGGMIHVYSEPGYGTRMAIYLPRDIYETSSEEEHDEVISSDLMGTETILVVDDEVSMREYAYEILTRNNYKVLCAENGIEALRILELKAVNMVLTDVIMPEMNGYELSTKIRMLYPDMKIQIASGFTDELTIGTTNEELHSQRLQKPFTSNVLLKKIREVLDSENEIITDSVNSEEGKPLMPIEWTDRYSSGLEVMDSDHKILINMINRCALEIKDNQSHKAISSILNDLVAYVDHHFKREELLMEVCGFPDSENHHRLHENMRKDVSGYVMDYGQGNLTAASLLDALLGWLNNHIVAEDLAIATYCKGKDKEIEQAFNYAGFEYQSNRDE